MALWRPQPVQAPHQPQPERRSRGLPGAAAQSLARPDADLSAGGWTTDTGATTGLWEAVDEAAADDGDHVRSASDPASDTLILGLESVGDAGVSYAGSHRVRFRYGKPPGDTVRIDLTVTLQAGATDVATRTFQDVPAFFTEGALELTAAEISDFRANGGYADARLKLVATQV